MSGDGPDGQDEAARFVPPSASRLLPEPFSDAERTEEGSDIESSAFLTWPATATSASRSPPAAKGRSWFDCCC